MTGAKFKLFCVQATGKLNALDTAYNLDIKQMKMWLIKLLFPICASGKGAPTRTLP